MKQEMMLSITTFILIVKIPQRLYKRDTLI